MAEKKIMIDSVRTRIERNAKIHPRPSLKLSREYFSLMKSEKQRDTHEYMAACGYFLFLKDYIHNPLAAAEAPVFKMDNNLSFSLFPDLCETVTPESLRMAYRWRSLFAEQEEVPSEPIYSIEIGAHCATLEKAFVQSEEENMYRIGIDGEKSFWISSSFVNEDDGGENIFRDLLTFKSTVALLEDMKQRGLDITPVISYFDQVICRVCSKRFDYDGLYSPMLTDERWKEVYEHYGYTEHIDSGGEDSGSLYICLECMEKALGRKLIREDVNDSPYNSAYLDARGWI